MVGPGARVLEQITAASPSPDHRRRNRFTGSLTTVCRQRPSGHSGRDFEKSNVPDGRHRHSSKAIQSRDEGPRELLVLLFLSSVTSAPRQRAARPRARGVVPKRRARGGPHRWCEHPRSLRHEPPCEAQKAPEQAREGATPRARGSRASSPEHHVRALSSGAERVRAAAPPRRRPPSPEVSCCRARRGTAARPRTPDPRGAPSWPTARPSRGCRGRARSSPPTRGPSGASPGTGCPSA
jgi:hypothetical protein